MAQADDVFDKLGWQGLVQTQFRAEIGYGLRRGVGAQHRRRGIARDDAHQKEDQNERADAGWNQLQETRSDVAHQTLRARRPQNVFPGLLRVSRERRTGAPAGLRDGSNRRLCGRARPRVPGGASCPTGSTSWRNQAPRWLLAGASLSATPPSWNGPAASPVESCPRR